MAGQIKRALDAIIQERCKGNETQATLTKVKLLMKGIDYEKFTLASPDDPVTLDKLRSAAREMNIAHKF